MGIFSAIFKALMIANAQKEIKNSQNETTNEMDFCNHPGIIKRSELTDEDIENLRRSMEEDEILVTAQSIQELKYYIAQECEASPKDVEVFSGGNVFVEGRQRYKWRYNEFGMLEYYIPGSNPTQSMNYEQEYEEAEEDFLYEFDEEINEDTYHQMH